ncbi:hypothetical protein GGI43DRAFT_390632, partial [Trichoderma evansii]
MVLKGFLRVSCCPKQQRIHMRRIQGMYHSQGQQSATLHFLRVGTKDIHSSCTKCKTKITQGYSYCQKCAFTTDSCPMCGKPNKKSNSKAPTIDAYKNTL